MPPRSEHIYGVPDPDHNGPTILGPQAKAGVWYIDQDGWWVKRLNETEAQWYGTSGSFIGQLTTKVRLTKAKNQNPEVVRKP